MYKFWGWLGFGALLLLLLLIDLATHRTKEGESYRAARMWITVWIGAGLGFNIVAWTLFGVVGAQEYIAAYLIEESLSLDNVFVFFIIFQTMRIPARYQHRVLFWGVFGAVVLRAAFIFTGLAALNRWRWITLVLGGALMYSAYGVLREGQSKKTGSRFVEWLSQHLPVRSELSGSAFVIYRGSRFFITPMLVALVAIELSDVAFAVDSIPAAFSVSRHPFIIYTSNVFAILGLRALYVVLAHAFSELKYLRFGLAGVLGFAGAKLTLSRWLRIPPLLSVAVILIVIGIVVCLSLLERKSR